MQLYVAKVCKKLMKSCPRNSVAECVTSTNEISLSRVRSPPGVVLFFFSFVFVLSIYHEYNIDHLQTDEEEAIKRSYWDIGI